MIDLVVFYSTSTKNTERFVHKLGLEYVQIPRKGDSMPVVDRPYCLIVPTYKGGVEVAGSDFNVVPKQVHKFLRTGKNRDFAKLVIASGNLNFGQDYAIAGDAIQKEYGIPYKYRFELSGNSEDVDVVLHGLRTFA